jgi:choline dehydrogenase
MLAEFDFIIVGAGAGGGPLACNLALAPEGYRVALLEAGGDPAQLPQTYHYFNYAIPGLHAHASEDPGTSWRFFVNHYADPQRQRQDSKLRNQPGIFYPRAAAVGGCTAHHAMITVYPHHSDWQKLADLTGDPSWSPERMRTLFERLEDCRYLPRVTGQSRDAATRHGFAGWLPVSMPDPTLALEDPELLRLVFRAFLAAQAAVDAPGALAALLKGKDEAGPADKEQKLAAANKAVGHLLDVARRAAQRAPATLGGAIARLKSPVERLKEAIAQEADPFEAVLQNADLLELFRVVHTWLDPNRWPADGARPGGLDAPLDYWSQIDAQRTGVYNTPASVLNGVRSAVRERILAVQARYPDRLVLIPHALATEVLIDPGKRAAGVRYLEGSYLYRASAHADPNAPLPEAEKFRELRLRPRGEVILAGGTFNTPQLLMLSGVGPAVHLEAKGIKVQCDLPGVGRNLQDRYEVSLVSELPDDFKILAGVKFEAPDGDDPTDQALQDWLNYGGVYATNGAVLTIIKTSRQAERNIPDLFIFGLPGYFRGYYVGYSNDTQSEVKNDVRRENHRRFSWVILKGSTRNRAGVVELTTRDPRDPPAVNFNYFDQGTPGWEKDRDALIEGIRFAQQVMRAAAPNAKTLIPPPGQDDAQLGEFIRNEAWGHHACGTCKIGKDGDSQAVLDGDFRVRGVENLRVVDASVFPEIPGFFIVTSVYMISEKASDVILADRRRATPRPWARAAGQ